MKTLILAQCAAFMIYVRGTCLYLALLVAAARVLCAAYISVSTPAMLSVSLTHRLTVSLETGL